MSLKDREIDENGFAIIEPLLQMDVDTKKDEKKYSKIYHRELFEWKSSVSSVVVSLSRINENSFIVELHNKKV